jgi:phenylalanyl-tRNA synthetase beta subunit
MYGSDHDEGCYESIHPIRSSTAEKRFKNRIVLKAKIEQSPYWVATCLKDAHLRYWNHTNLSERMMVELVVRQKDKELRLSREYQSSSRFYQ